MMLLALLAACLPKVQPYEPKLYALNLPEGFHTTRPLPCPFEEVMIVEAEGWMPAHALEGMRAWVQTGMVDAVIDIKASKQWVPVAESQCQGMVNCRWDSVDVRWEAELWTVGGRGVRWTCPGEDEAMEGEPAVEDTGDVEVGPDADEEVGP